MENRTMRRSAPTLRHRAHRTWVCSLALGIVLGATPLWSQQRPDTSKAARDSAMK